MEFLEKELEQIIWESDNYKLRKRGLFINGKKFRQLRIGNYGFLDLLTVKKMYWNDYGRQPLSPYLNITVYELKKEKAGISAFLQALRYARGIKSFLEQKHPKIDFRLHISLCSKNIDTHSDFVFLTDLIQDDFGEGMPNKSINTISCYSTKYNLDGIFFKIENGYDLTNKGF